MRFLLPAVALGISMALTGSVSAQQANSCIFEDLEVGLDGRVKISGVAMQCRFENGEYRWVDPNDGGPVVAICLHEGKSYSSGAPILIGVKAYTCGADGNWKE